MELNKLRELVALLREAGVSKYADEKIQLELVYDEIVEDEDDVEIPTAQTSSRSAPEVDPTLQRVVNSLPPDYVKAFDIKIRGPK